MKCDILDQCNELQKKLADVADRAEKLFARLTVYPDMEMEIADQTKKLEAEMVDCVNGLLQLDHK